MTHIINYNTFNVKAFKNKIFWACNFNGFLLKFYLDHEKYTKKISLH